MTKRLVVSAVAVVLGLLFTVASGAQGFPSGTFTLEDPSGSVWEVDFDGEGQYKVLLNGDVGVAGAYEVSEDEIEFRDQEGPLAEPGKVGTYTWELAGKSLTFTKVSDEAEGRSQALTGGPWEMKDETP